MQVTEPAQSTLRQGVSDWALFSLLSDSDVSYMLIPFRHFRVGAGSSCQMHSIDCNHGCSGSTSPIHIATQRRPVHDTFLALSVERCSGVSIAH